MKFSEKVFKTISIEGITKQQLLQRLIAVGIQFNKYAHDLFNHSQFSPPSKNEQVELVKVTLSDVGLNNPSSYLELINRVSTLGLKPCPLYIGAYLRLEYLDQPAGPYLTIASIKPENDADYPNGFYIRNFENELWLRGYRADDFCDWPDQNEFVFLKESPNATRALI